MKSKIVLLGPTGIDYFNDLLRDGKTLVSAGGVCRNIALDLWALGLVPTLITQNYANSLETVGVVTPMELNQHFISTPSDYVGWLASYRATFDGVDVVEVSSNYEASPLIFTKSVALELAPILNDFDIIITCSDVSEGFWLNLPKSMNQCLVTSGTPAPINYLDWLSHCDSFFINREEAASIGLSPTELCLEAKKRGVKQTIVTMGKDGGVYYLEDKGEPLRATSTASNEILSPLGAGDALVAGVIFGLSQEYSLEQSIEFGMKMATLKLSYQGSAFTQRLNVDLEHY